MQHNHISEQAEPTLPRARTPVDWANVHRASKGCGKGGRGGAYASRKAWGGRGRPPTYAEVTTWPVANRLREDAQQTWQGRQRWQQKGTVNYPRRISIRRQAAESSHYHPERRSPHRWGAGWHTGPVHPWLPWYYTSGRGQLGPRTARLMGGRIGPQGGWKGGGGRGYPQRQAIRPNPQCGGPWGRRGGGPDQWTHQSNCRVPPGSTPAWPRPAPVGPTTFLAGAGSQPAPGWTLVDGTRGGSHRPTKGGNIGNHTWSDHNPWQTLQRSKTVRRKGQCGSPLTMAHPHCVGPKLQLKTTIEEVYSRRIIAPGRSTCHCAPRGGGCGPHFSVFPRIFIFPHFFQDFG